MPNQNIKELLVRLDKSQIEHARVVPDLDLVKSWVDQMFSFLFPINQAIKPSEQYLSLSKKLHTILGTVVPEVQVHKVAEQFFQALGSVYDTLQADIDAFLSSDPAATSRAEIAIAYPGFFAIAVYRLAHELHTLAVPLVPRICTEYAHSKTGIDIHPGSIIGQSFFIDHGTGVVIGETAHVGNHVKIFQGVTLGALQVSKHMAAQKRHPTIEDHVIIYANATILGGETIIGHHSMIGGNAWLTQSVDPWAIVQHSAQVRIRSKQIPDAIIFEI
jgi:serine O-acetyltransferase